MNAIQRSNNTKTKPVPVAGDSDYTGETSYIVKGVTESDGNYSEWNVRVFDNEDEANVWSKECNEWVQGHIERSGDHNYLDPSIPNPYDPYMTHDSPAYYEVEPIEFGDPE